MNEIFLFLGISQEQLTFDKKQFVTYMKGYIKLLTPKLEPEKIESFKKNIEGATNYLLSKLSDLQLQVLNVPDPFFFNSNFNNLLG